MNKVFFAVGLLVGFLAAVLVRMREPMPVMRSPSGCDAVQCDCGSRG